MKLIKNIFAIYLVFFKGYSVMKMTAEYNDGKTWGACSNVLTFNYGHNGKWGIGHTPFEAVLDCYKNVKNG